MARTSKEVPDRLLGTSEGLLGLGARLLSGLLGLLGRLLRRRRAGGGSEARGARGEAAADRGADHR